MPSESPGKGQGKEPLRGLPLSSEDEALLVGRDASLVLVLGLHGVDGNASLDLDCDGLAGQCPHEDLHVC